MSIMITDGTDFAEKELLNNWAAEYAKRAVKEHREASPIDHPDGSVTGDKIAEKTIQSSNLDDNCVITPRITDKAVTTQKIADYAVTTIKLGQGAVTNSRIGNDAVDGRTIADGAVGTEHITSAAVTSGKIADGAVTGDKIAEKTIQSSNLDDNCVITPRITDKAVTTQKIADYAVTTIKLGQGAVTNNSIGNDAVDSRAIADGAVGTEHIASAAVTSGKIADGAVTGDKIAEKTIQSRNLDDNCVITPRITDKAVTTQKIADYAVTTIKLGQGAVDTRTIADAAVTADKLSEKYIKAKESTVLDQEFPDGDYSTIIYRIEDSYEDPNKGLTETCSHYILSGVKDDEYVWEKILTGTISSENTSFCGYSTTPVRIGTWIDGTPIWRKAFEYTFTAEDLSSFKEEKSASVSGIASLGGNPNNTAVLGGVCWLRMSGQPCIIDDTQSTHIYQAYFMFPDLDTGYLNNFAADSSGFYGYVDYMDNGTA